MMGKSLIYEISLRSICLLGSYIVCCLILFTRKGEVFYVVEELSNVSFVELGLFDSFDVLMKVILLVSVFSILPLLLVHVFLFLSSGLYLGEQLNFLKFLLLFCSVLFLLVLVFVSVYEGLRNLILSLMSSSLVEVRGIGVLVGHFNFLLISFWFLILCLLVPLVMIVCVNMRVVRGFNLYFFRPYYYVLLIGVLGSCLVGDFFLFVLLNFCLVCLYEMCTYLLRYNEIER